MDERGLLESIFGLYGFGSPAMLISGSKHMVIQTKHVISREAMSALGF